MNEKAFRRLFASERLRFSKRYPHVRSVELYVESEEHGRRYRDVAYSVGAGGRGNSVFFVRRALRFSRGRLVALLRHELAHCCNMNLSEVETDRLAEKIGGQKLFYDRMDLQTVDRVRGAKEVRPSYLHQ